MSLAVFDVHTHVNNLSDIAEDVKLCVCPQIPIRTICKMIVKLPLQGSFHLQGAVNPLG